MFRAILELIVVVVIITALRSVIGIIGRAFTNAANPPGESAARPRSVPTGGELKKDPVCGTFISTTTAIQMKAGGETYYFCSAECRDKFKS